MPTQKITREEMMFKSISVFRQKGYYRTNMSDLAKTCGLTKGAFYHHFSSKAEVMQNALLATASWFNEYVFAIAYNPDLDGKTKLLKMSEITLKAFTRERGGCFFANTILETAHVEDTFKPIIIDYFQQWQLALEHIFQSKYSSTKATTISTQIISDIEGSIILMQLHDDVNYLQNAIDRCLKLY